MIKFGKWEDAGADSRRKSLMRFPDGTSILEAIVLHSFIVSNKWCFFIIDKEYGTTQDKIMCKSMEQAKFIGDLYMMNIGFNIEEPFFLERNNV